MMRAWLGFLAGVVLLVGAACADDLLPIPPVARVTDTTGTLSADQKQALESKIASIEQRKGSQVAVLIVPTTQPEEIEQYSYRVADAWKLGRKDVNDGVLLTVCAKNDHHSITNRGGTRARRRGSRRHVGTHHSRIHHAEIPQRASILQEGGISDAVDALGKLIDRRADTAAARQQRNRTRKYSAAHFFLNNMVFFIFGIFWLRGLVGGLPSVPRRRALSAPSQRQSRGFSSWIDDCLGGSGHFRHRHRIGWWSRRGIRQSRRIGRLDRRRLRWWKFWWRWRVQRRRRKFRRRRRVG